MQRGKSDKGKDKEKYGEFDAAWIVSDRPIYDCSISTDDPYYCGLRARVPNFAKQNGKTNGTISEKKTSFFGKKDNKSKEKEKDVKEKETVQPKQRPSTVQMPHPASFSTLYQLHQMQNGTMGTVSKRATYQRHNSQPEPYSMWHAKSYESGIGKV